MLNKPIAASYKTLIAKPIAARSAEAALVTVDLFATAIYKHAAAAKQGAAVANAVLFVIEICRLRVAPT